jgi:pSer/pThr/pTyr-binding forkhead associated (FHA) protein
MTATPSENVIEVGVVCGRCDGYSPIQTATCPTCGNALALLSGRPKPHVTTPMAAVSEPPLATMFDEPLQPRKHTPGGTPAVRGAQAIASPGPPPLSSPQAATVAAGNSLARSAGPGVAGLSLEELMEQAKNFLCRSCSTQVPMGHKFCGRCGAAVPPEILNARTQFFGQLQIPGKAKLILIRGEGVEGLSYQLNAEQHIVGRNGQLVFPDDPFVSPKHANLFYRNNKLVVKDEGSLNGVFLRVRGTVDVESGDEFLAGEQLFSVESPPKIGDGPSADGTYFYTSPKHQFLFRITQILQGGGFGMSVLARTNVLQIGREGGDLNFPNDLYMSASHCKIEESAGKLTLTDLNSRNGTYLRIKDERELAHGDYLFMGRKLLRVEITAA